PNQFNLIQGGGTQTVQNSTTSDDNNLNQVKMIWLYEDCEHRVTQHSRHAVGYARKLIIR
ncbi:hypothetical protein, partial [Candidatus Regiella insecticola]|uniref:hypothetical protein n=1 Tax=Candidatus Regiella insecticola TaxID=138073 RepID=UPI001C3F6DAC